MTRGQLPQRAGSLGLNGGGAAAVVPLFDTLYMTHGRKCSGYRVVLHIDFMLIYIIYHLDIFAQTYQLFDHKSVYLLQTVFASGLLIGTLPVKSI